MSYVVRTTLRFEKEFKKLDRYTMKMIKAWIEKNLSGCENPRVKGKALTANRKGQWRYRIGDYRLLCLCLLYTSPSPRDRTRSRMPSSA